MAASSAPSGAPDEISEGRRRRPWMWSLVLGATFTLAAAAISIELGRYGWGATESFDFSLVFWSILAVGVVVMTAAIAPIGVWERLACVFGAWVGGAASGVVYWVHEGHDFSYFVLIAGIVSGYLVGVLLVWMLIVGALLRASGARGFPDALGKIALVTLGTGAIAIASVIILGERGTFVCPPWPLTTDQVPHGYCSELVDRGLVASYEPFQMRCREVPESALGPHMSNDAPYARDQTLDTRSILGVAPSTAIAMRVTWPSRPDDTERRRADCGEWNLAPSALLSLEEVRELAQSITSGAEIAD